MSLQEQKNNFFELGRAICRFVTKRADKYEYVIVRKITNSLELEISDANKLFKELTSSGVTTAKWFSDSRSRFENYYDLGQFAEDFFLNYSFYLHNRDSDFIEKSAQRLLSLCAEVGVPREIIDDYLTGIKNSFGVPKEKRKELEADAAALGIFLREDDPILRGNIREIGDAEAVHSRFVQQVSNNLLGNRSSEAGPGDGIFDNLGSTPLVFDDEVSETLQLTVDEASMCYEHECYLATIALCGKIIETLLANSFQTLMKKLPSEKMSFGEIRAALRGKGTPLDDSVDELLDLIYTHRSVVIHRGNLRKISFPTEGQAKHVAGLTQEVINIIYAYFNDQTDASESGPSGA